MDILSDTVLEKLREMSTGRFKGKAIGADTLSLVCNVNINSMEQILQSLADKGQVLFYPGKYYAANKRVAYAKVQLVD